MLSIEMRDIIEKIENIKISFGYSILIFCFAIFLRAFFENFININNLGMLTDFTDIFLHFPIWFLTVFVGISFIISFFTKKPISKIFKLVSLSSFIIISPVIIDIIFYHHKIGYMYVVGNWMEIMKHYFTFFFSSNAVGVGIKTEIIIVFIAIFSYVYLQTKSLLKSILAAWLSYTIIFCMIILPNIIYFVASLFSKLPDISSLNVNNYFFPTSLDGQMFISRPYLSDAILGVVRFGMNQNLFAIIMAQASLFIGVIFSVCSASLYFGFNRTKEIIKNFRFLRIGHYFFLVILGILLGQNYIGYQLLPFNIYDWFSLISLFISLLCAWLFAVWENDEEDKEIDALSNPERPLVKGGFSNIEWKNIKWSFFISSIVSGLLAGYTSFVMILVFLIIYHIYSMSPLRFKKYPIISSILIGINACMAFLLGFFFICSDKSFNILPIGVLLGILIFYSLVENIKNLKDVEGDKKEGILTIPVIFGETKGKIITWLLVLGGSFVIPLLVFPGNRAFLLSPILGVVSYFFIVRKEYKERPLMVFYIISFIIVLILNL